MATAMGMMGSIGGCGAASASLFRLRNSAKKKTRNDKNGFRVSCVYSSSAVADPYKTLKIQPGASESEVRKAFRQLALKVRTPLLSALNLEILNLFSLKKKTVLVFLYAFN
uniref:DnaJ protein n=1 Tax=Solanum tuberosum TaxID=4113 RepID=M1B4C4_SOLTU